MALPAPPPPRSLKVDFYNSLASGIRNYREASKDMAKKNDQNVCASLRKRVEDSVRGTEKLDTELKQRRERCQHHFQYKKGFEEEHRYFTNSLGKLQEQLKVLLGASAGRFVINHSYLVLVQPGSTII